MLSKSCGQKKFKQTKLKQETMSNNDFNERINAIEPKIKIKSLVDNFAILGDQKKLKEQSLLFTEDGIVELYFNDQLASTLKGRKEIEGVFTAFTKTFETVYHFNGQHAITINGNKSTGIAYCLTVLVGEENGKKMKTTYGIRYQDEYVYETNQWLIAKRKSTFAWQDKEELGQ